MHKILIASLFFCFLFIAKNSSAQIHWLTNFDLGLSVAEANNKLVVVDFWATWCGPCKKMDEEVWSTPDAKKLQSIFVPVKVDIDNDRTLAMSYGVRAIPMVIVMDYTGKVIHSATGYNGKSSLMKILENIPVDVSGYYQELKKLKKEDSGVHQRDVGIALQSIASTVMETDVKYSLLKQSDLYLKKGKKELESEADKLESELLLAINDLYRSREKKVIKDVTELITNPAIEEGSKSKAISYWILAEAYKSSGDSTNCKKYQELLKIHPLADQVSFVTRK